MAEQVEKSDGKIKVTVKTPRDKKEVYIEGNGTIKQVMLDHSQSVQHIILFI